MKSILKFALFVNTICWLIVPWMFPVIFSYLRISGIINTPWDWAIGSSVFVVLLSGSVYIGFLAFGKGGNYEE